MLASPDCDSLPSSLTDFVRRRFEAVGLPAAAAEAAVQQLATLAAAQPRARSWFHEKGRLAAEFLESDASVAAALAAAEIDVGGVLETRAERSLRSSRLFEVINGHHRVLRQALGSGAEGVPIHEGVPMHNGSGGAPKSAATVAGGAAPAAGTAPTPGAAAAGAAAGATTAGGHGWAEAVEDPAALRRYAAAAAQIGAKAWVREGVEWCAQQARAHFYGGAGRESGAVTLARKEVARRAWRARGAPLSDAQAARLLATLRADPDLLRPEGAPPLELLDVGSCSSMFEGQVRLSVGVSVGVRVRVRAS